MSLTTLSLVSLMGCERSSLPSPEDDRDILRAAMEHFVAREDILWSTTNRTLLVEPKTHIWTDAESFSPENAGCKIPSRLYSAIAKRSTIVRPAAELLTMSPHWRISVASDRVKANPPVQYIDVDPSTKVPIVQIKISAPSFSSSGNEALAIIQFDLSIHTGDAYYLLKRSSQGWIVSCSVELFGV
jgi:hypothetical protein